MFPQVCCEVKAIHNSLKNLVLPVLRELDWPAVPARLTRRHPLIRVSLGTVAWRLPTALQSRVDFTLARWWPQGLTSVSQTQTIQAWLEGGQAPAAPVELFPQGFTPDGPPLKGRR